MSPANICESAPSEMLEYPFGSIFNGTTATKLTHVASVQDKKYRNDSNGINAVSTGWFLL